MKDKTILIWYEWQDIIALLTPKQKGQVFRAIIHYAAGEKPEIPNNEAVEMVFMGLCVDLDEGMANFENTKKVRSAAGKKSAEMKKLNKNQQKSTKLTKATDSESNSESNSNSDTESNADAGSDSKSESISHAKAVIVKQVVRFFMQHIFAHSLYRGSNTPPEAPPSS